MNRTFARIVALTIMALAVPVFARLVWADGIGTNQNRLIATGYGLYDHTLPSLPCANYITAFQAARSVWNYATDPIGIFMTYGLAILTVLVFAGSIWATRRLVVRRTIAVKIRL